VLSAVADPDILKRGGAEENVSVPSSLVANAHSELLFCYSPARHAAVLAEHMNSFGNTVIF